MSETADETAETSEAEVEFSEEDLTSPEISRILRKIDTLKEEIDNTKAEIVAENEELKKMDEEYGSEIDRVKKEFNRMKERSIEEAIQISNKAKVDALKEVMPITDNYFRAKSIFDPLETDNEKLIAETYDAVFAEFDKVLANFGVTRVESLGQPFDFNFMEAIMTAPSADYPKDVVCQEFQVGYKMGDECVRPAMVVVSLGM
eukprot:CAMPEP_0174978554 /NCGR_PEP_ID=MMETSP0004_2-20121128/14275_1 /TAXON_ID=420556 /ORGANISM="Ochromonas sp., Strain CCMP1393" /LENGTH=202 /DNA_ID=CAMNT_0016229953 /DNA_START=174 /DNA_END=782 /DNA_ORIENTATION=-